MYINSAYRNHSLQDYKDKSKPLIVGSCGTYHLFTKEKLPKQELIRVVRTPEGEVKIDLVGKMNGRGAYLSKSVNAVEIARKKKILDRHLEVQVSDEVFDELLKIVSEE